MRPSVSGANAPRAALPPGFVPGPMTAPSAATTCAIQIAARRRSRACSPSELAMHVLAAFAAGRITWRILG
jgi:hypothetical protein